MTLKLKAEALPKNNKYENNNEYQEYKLKVQVRTDFIDVARMDKITDEELSIVLASEDLSAALALAEKEESIDLKKPIITELSFFCCLNSHNLIPIAHFLSKNRTLRKLDFRLNLMAIDNEAVVALVDALAENKTLKVLNIGGIKMSEYGATLLANTLAKKNKTLRELDLSGCVGPKVAEIFAKVFSDIALTKLNLSANHINDDGAILLANALTAGNETLCELKLATNNIGPKGASAFAKVITSDVALSRLNFSNNHIGNHGAIALGNALIKRNKPFEKLVLNKNAIDDAGMTPFAKANVEIFSCADNYLTDESVKLLAENPYFQIVDFDRNLGDITKEGSITLINKTHARRLHLPRIKNLSDDSEFQKAFFENNTLTDLVLRLSLLDSFQSREREREQKQERDRHLAQNYDAITTENRFLLSAFVSKQPGVENFDKNILKMISQMHEDPKETEKHAKALRPK